MVILVSLVLLNAYEPMVVTELPMVALARYKQMEKALLPMVLTELGITILVSPEQQ